MLSVGLLAVVVLVLVVRLFGGDVRNAWMMVLDTFAFGGGEGGEVLVVVVGVVPNGAGWFCVCVYEELS